MASTLLFAGILGPLGGLFIVWSLLYLRAKALPPKENKSTSITFFYGFRVFFYVMELVSKPFNSMEEKLLTMLSISSPR